jgi:hypothetical protein
MLTKHDFERRFQELDFLSCVPQTMDQFNLEYERLLNTIKNHQGPRLELSLKLKALQIKQGFFLCTMAEMERLKDEQAGES